MEEKKLEIKSEKDKLTDINAEQVSGGAYGLTCQRCGCHLSVCKWRDNGGYCSRCLRILREERTSRQKENHQN